MCTAHYYDNRRKTEEKKKKNLVKEKVVAEITGEQFDSVERDGRGVVEVVDDDGPEPAQQELEHRVAPNITGSAGDQDALRHNNRNTAAKTKTVARTTKLRKPSGRNKKRRRPIYRRDCSYRHRCRFW
jgi:hypothetical protein